MISIIISTRNPNQLASILENIEATIGVDYEIIAVENSSGTTGLCRLYNESANKAKYDFLCFMHEDILFHTNNWGDILIKLLNIQDTGLVGVIGATYKSRAPSPWWISNYTLEKKFYRGNILQHSSKGLKLDRYSDFDAPTQSESEVVVLDGVWVCCSKKKWSEVMFDEKFDKFHFYDLDISLNMHQRGYKNVVTYDVLIEHFSSGNIDANWIIASQNFYFKWRYYLPVGVINLSHKEKNRIERVSLINQLTEIQKNKVKSFFWFYWWGILVSLSPFNIRSFLFLKTYLKFLFSSNNS